ncbi:MAG TPA: MerR family transcriptional regulator [Pseudogracilibacillus sp.]|nr:MerR family transcriptional regulator [Pseudogracilibacillus sp.]
MKVKEVAELTGVSVRTLHHYDQIGLLSPDTTTDAGYRIYSAENIDMLQQILFFKALGFSLAKIKNIMHDRDFNRLDALQLQKEMLLEKRAQVNQMISMIEQTIQHEKGVIHMSQKDKFTGFTFGENKYEAEARKRWGNEAIDATKQTINKMSKDDKKANEAKMNDIFRSLANLLEQAPHDEQVQTLIQTWHQFLNNTTGYHYSLDAFQGLGQMYVADERFTKNIDQFGDGLAQFMSDAIAVYVKNNK